ncbi:MAG TPA: UxaA family hydrolase, partial [Terriglobales bacterium]|nr:UxaA family hydrolase [Terriglobales bacterium]
MRKVLQLDPRDSVLIALTDLNQGETVEFNGSKYSLVSRVPAKHKFAMDALPVGAKVTMYGVLVGKTIQPVRRGEALTLANIQHESLAYHEKSEDFRWTAPNVSRWKGQHFLGYQRSDGQVGTRNYWIVVPLVFCENRNILNLKQAFEEELGFATPQLYRQQVAELAGLYRQGKTAQIRTHAAPKDGDSASPKRLFQNLDGIRFLLHEGGCGGTREDSNNLCGLIAGYIHHPNVAGATVLS